jgi:hypothetical protein
MRSSAIAGALAALVLAPGAAAQVRLPVPDSAARDAARDELLELLAQMGGDDDVPTLLALAWDDRRTAALRWELLAHGVRCAAARGELEAGLRLATVASDLFADDLWPQAFLQRCETHGSVPPRALVGAHLDVARATLTNSEVACATALANAQRLARGDELPGITAYAAAVAAELAAARTTFERMPAPQPMDVLRFRAFHLGEWSSLLAAVPDAERRTEHDRTGPGGTGPGGTGPDRTASDRIERAFGDKVHAHAGGDPLALARAADPWLSLATAETNPLAQRHLRRRAMALLLPLAHGDPAADPSAADPLEVQRARALLERTTALAVEPIVGTLRFTHADDLTRLHLDGGRWSIDGTGDSACLVGLSLGGEHRARATSRTAFRRIDAVTIRAGIRSAAGLNLRLAVGGVNLLFNWEVADENHAFFRSDATGEQRFVTSPRRLTAGTTHTIRLHQAGEEVIVLVDGDEVVRGTASLAGTVCVYPAIGSEVFVRSIDIVGEPDLARVVVGPDWTR